MRHPLQVIMMFLQQFHQIGRCARFKPIAAEILTFESIKQTERIVHTNRIVRKMVTVIALSQLFTKFIIRYSARSSKFMKLCFQIVVDFTLANATDFDILIPHGYIIQVVQVTKHTDFAKLCHTGKECKLDATVHCFKRSIKRL